MCVPIMKRMCVCVKEKERKGVREDEKGKSILGRVEKLHETSKKDMERQYLGSDYCGQIMISH